MKTRQGLRLSLAAVSIILLIAPPCISSASNERVALGVSSVNETVKTEGFSSIVSLRLKMNDRAKVTLLDKSIVDCQWLDNRSVPVGPRLYYEVLDASGNVVAKGFRKDPRLMKSGNGAVFLLTTPYTSECTSINLYYVDYESGGKGGYSREYALLASFDLRHPEVAAIR